MKCKVNELQGAALDWAVAMCENFDFDIAHSMILLASKNAWGERRVLHPCDGGTEYRPSVRWNQGGPIIERERISVEVLKEGDGWCATFGCTPHDFLMWDQPPYSADASYGEGATALEAAMRCYVASKLDDEIEVPDVLGVTN